MQNAAVDVASTSTPESPSTTKEENGQEKVSSDYMEDASLPTPSETVPALPELPEGGLAGWLTVLGG